MKNEIPVYAIDFEGSKSLGIVEFGIAGISDGEIFAAETSICAPREKISARDASFFGIDNAKASGHPPFEVHSELFMGLRASGMFAAHSCQTEDTLIRSHLPSPGRMRNFFSGEETLSWGPWIDSRRLAKIISPDLASGKLSETIAELGVQGELDAYASKFCPPERSKWHCALYDALASALIIKHALPLVRDMEELGKICGQTCEFLFE